MRIIHFYAENFKRLKVVEFDPGKNVVVIAGRNGQGKSSILDAIWATFKNAAAKKQMPSPIRHGEQHAKTVITLEDYTVTRTFKDGRSTLRIETRDGNIVKSPQALLDRIIGDLSFDPLVFANAKDADRRQMLHDVFDLDLAEFDAKDNSLKEEKKEKTRELTMIDGRMRAIKPPTGGESLEETSVGNLVSKMTSITRAINEFKRLNDQEAEIDRQLAELTKKKESIHRQRSTLADEYGRTPPTQEDVDKLQEEIANVETHNVRVKEINEYMRLRDLHDAASQRLEQLKASIELNKIEKAEAIESAEIPLDGLTIEEDGIFLNNTPFDQLSQAEKIKASLSIAMSANPELRVIRIVDGSLLDSENMKLVEKMAEEHDMQVWVERVDESGKIGIVIEDGEVTTKN